MTPISLQENFLNEVMFCGFRHFRLKNYWVPFSLKENINKLFAMQVVGIPEKHVATILRNKDEERRVFWMPDLSKDEEENNFEKPAAEGGLQDWEKTAVREQI